MPARCLAFLLVAASLGAVVPRYVALGFTHIVPHGLDHVLFILGLFFLVRDATALLMQVTLFTIAHSMTLGLSIQGLATLPTTWVEVAIALSITFIAAETLCHGKLSRWRSCIVFASGLVHGLGFAHAFQETAVLPGELLIALFSFNIGIELGQLCVVGVAIAMMAAWWRRDWYCRAVARPASIVLAATGLYWAVERSL